MTDIKTLGELKKSGYTPRSIKEEMRANMVKAIQEKQNLFEGIIGYSETVLPDIERAILSRHSILLLGLRGQAKTRIARMMVRFLDEFIPVIEGSEINDDPLQPISRYGIDKVAELGDKTPITWMHRDDRYVEKLATPDVSVADLIGDMDPIKAANLKLPYSDERVLHFGLIPRAHRCIFVINELPDLQPRIQVALFNILQESDMQIRGFKVRLPLDISFIFTANPEDYTNRGSIITPLKDRIESQIHTHYLENRGEAMEIGYEQSDIHADQKDIKIALLHREVIECLMIVARESEFIDHHSGVSPRLAISAIENLVSTAERRALITGDKKTHTRVSDFRGIMPSISGKLELLYEGEQEGTEHVAELLLADAKKMAFLSYFPHPDELTEDDRDPYDATVSYFRDRNQVELDENFTDKEFVETLSKVPGLKRLAAEFNDNYDSDLEEAVIMEFILHGMSEVELIGKNYITANKITFEDPLGDIF